MCCSCMCLNNAMFLSRSQLHTGLHVWAPDHLDHCMYSIRCTIYTYLRACLATKSVSTYRVKKGLAMATQDWQCKYWSGVCDMFTCTQAHRTLSGSGVRSGL